MTVAWQRRLKPELDHELLWGLIGVTTLGLGAVWLSWVGPPPVVCPLRELTGVPCPTCGATRAAMALLSGAWMESLRLNPLVVSATIAAAIYLPYALTVSLLDLPRLRLRLDPEDWRRARTAVGATLAGLWIFLLLDGR